MFKQIGNWFEQTFQLDTPPDDEHSVELCTAALLYQIMRADDQVEESEQQKMQQLLIERYHLSEEEMQALMSLCSKEVDQAADFHQFTSVLNEKCSTQEKRTLIENLWAVAYADEQIDAIEEHLIRKIADLLYVPHSTFIQAKLKITQS